MRVALIVLATAVLIGSAVDGFWLVAVAAAAMLWRLGSGW